MGQQADLIQLKGRVGSAFKVLESTRRLTLTRNKLQRANPRSSILVT